MTDESSRVFNRGVYAHSVKGKPVDLWESLLKHLSETGSETANRAAKFGCASLGLAAGRLHDFGKFKDAFQRYLHEPKTKDKGHSAAGALFAQREFGWLGAFVAHVIAGHHAGLKDELLAKGGRLDREAGELDLAMAGFSANPSGFEPPACPGRPADFKADGQYPSGFQFAFLIRMLFSCLVDADRICTERFYAEHDERTRERGPQASIAELSAALEAWMADQARQRDESGTARNAVNLMRAKIHTDVIAHAADPEGVFTLTVPTGGGKTLTGLDFALRHAGLHGLDRVIVVIPFTSVIEQTAAVYRTALGDLAGEVLEHHSAFDEEKLRGENRQGLAKLQLDMENWDARIVVTTAVQFFESLFSNRPSRCRKLHNIAKSVVIIDEAQTIPLPLLRPCVAALKELAKNYGASIVLSTATQPALIERPGEPDRSFAGGFHADEVTELAAGVPNLFATMRRVTVKSIGEQSDEALVGYMENPAGALCIVATRRHARDLYRRVEEKMGHARHLSTMMHAADRSEVLRAIRADLSGKKPCRVVSTSLIEAGVDVDFPLVLRAETGLDQLAQSAGRLNREGRQQPDDSLLLLFKAAGQEPPKELAVYIRAATSQIRRSGSACLDPEAIEAYFRELYWKLGPNLDKHGILIQCEANARSLDFPFETIAGAVRFIETDMVPVIVATDDISRHWLAALKDRDSKETLRTITRGLQRYTVGLPRNDVERLLDPGVRAAAPVREETFGDQFIELLDMDLYKPDTGLDCSDPYFVDAGSLLV